MDTKEKMIRLWFSMWLEKRDLGIDNIFTDDAIYIESWGPEYIGVKKIEHWFHEWNTRGNVVIWDIKNIFHEGNQTLVEWYFKNAMNDGIIEAFDGITVVKWAENGKISFLKEYGCNIDHYDPYQDGLTPKFKDRKAMWF